LKILITGAKSAIAIKLLKAFDQHQVVLADYGEIPSFFSKNYRLISLGPKNEDTIAHTLLNNCLDEQIDAVLPIHTFEIIAVAKAKILFNEFDIEVLSPNQDDLDTYFNDHKNTKTIDWLIAIKGAIIFTTLIDDDLVEHVKKTNLSGAYYILKNGTATQLKLMVV
jgi:hypothetical protein